MNRSRPIKPLLRQLADSAYRVSPPLIFGEPRERWRGAHKHREKSDRRPRILPTAVRKPRAVVALATIEWPAHVKKRRAASDLRARPVEKDLSLASVRATSARRRHVPGPAFPVA